MHRNRFVWTLVFIALTLLSICPIILLSFYSFENFCLLILGFIGKTEKINEFQSRFLSSSRFQLLRLSAFAIPILMVSLLYLIYQFRVLLKRIFLKIYAKIKISFAEFLMKIYGLNSLCEFALWL